MTTPQEAADRAAYYGKSSDHGQVVAADELRDMGRKSGSDYLLRWDIEEQLRD